MPSTNEDLSWGIIFRPRRLGRLLSQLTGAATINPPVEAILDTTSRPTGPDAWDLIQMAQADEQMAAYLATNPDPLTGLPRDSTAPPTPSPPLPERERDRPSNIGYQHPYAWDLGSYSDETLPNANASYVWR